MPNVLMDVTERIRTQLGEAMSGVGSPAGAADRLCQACTELLEVDGASISLTLDGVNRGTFGSSGPLSATVDALQFTMGEGPCLDATRSDRPVLLADLRDVRHSRWPAFTEAVLDAGVRAIFAFPVRLASQPVGALDLFRARSGPLPDWSVAGARWAAELAALPLLDLMAQHKDWETANQPEDGWEQLASLQHVEVYQATGMIMAALDVDAAEAVTRLRAYAFARSTTAKRAAGLIVERQLSLQGPEWQNADPDSFGSGKTGAAS